MTETERLFERARSLDLSGQADAARQAYLAVLARTMAHAGALNNLGALLSRSGHSAAARMVWQQAVAKCPDDPMAFANLGNLLRGEGDDDGARHHFAAALQRDPDLPEAHQGLANLAAEAGDTAAAAWHRERGFPPRALTSAPYRGSGPPLRVLHLVSCHDGNIPARRLLPDTRFQVHSLFAEYADRVDALPPHDVVFNAIGDADLCGAGLRAAAALLRGRAAPVINPPARVLATGRLANAARLGRLPDVVTPRAAELTRAALLGPDAAAALARHGLGFPLLLRAPGYHTGKHFVRVESPADLPASLAPLPGATLLTMQALDARGPDGWHRKYRAMFIGGAILPLHLAVAAQWKVHYFTAGMEFREQHRAEEARYLADMPAVLGPRAMAALRRIAAALRLDYGGADFALSPDGRLLLFEANATMAVIPPADAPVWHYRQAAAATAIEAARSMLAARASCRAAGHRAA